MTILYHSTSPSCAASINRDGFRDADLSIPGHAGVWFADRPLTEADGLQQRMDFCFAVEFGDESLAEYFVDEAERPHAEYLIPASVANQHHRTKLSSEQRDDIVDRWFATYQAAIP